jgi:hypothetical protein
VRGARAWSKGSSTNRSGRPIAWARISVAWRYESASLPVMTYFLPV